MHGRQYEQNQLFAAFVALLSAFVSVLPYIVAAGLIAFAGGWVLNMRSVMINTIDEDYVALAHAKGLPDRRVMTSYAGRNAILPPLNGFAALFASAVIWLSRSATCASPIS